ncbi:hypothetical protein V1478_015285 [Vespula squamosa]|uniref:Uncharacterized protein n=1 Tax=Vespula squamosa TaxID=30214 RepID=A0ABD2A513_VESSQ
MSTYLNFNLPHFQPTTNHPPSFSTNYKSSTLNFDLNRGRVQQNPSRMALSHILILPCCHSKCSYIIIILISDTETNKIMTYFMHFYY